jgi:hypothetical protein
MKVHSNKYFLRVASTPLAVALLMLTAGAFARTVVTTTTTDKKTVATGARKDQHDRTEDILSRRPDDKQKKTAARRSLLPPITKNPPRSAMNYVGAQAASSSAPSAAAQTLPCYSLIGGGGGGGGGGNAPPPLQVTSPDSGKPAVPEYVMPEGTVLVKEPSQIIMEAPSHNANVRAGAVAYFIRLGNEVGFFNLDGDAHGSVSVRSHASKKTYDVPIGCAVIVTPNEIAGCSITKYISWNQPALLDTEEGLHIYQAGFPYVAALNSSKQFQEALHSANPAQRAMATKLLKLAAVSLAVNK